MMFYVNFSFKTLLNYLTFLSNLLNQVYSIPIGGMCVRQPCTIGGSGSSYVYGYIDAEYKPEMEKEQCADFVTKSNVKILKLMEHVVSNMIFF